MQKKYELVAMLNGVLTPVFKDGRTYVRQSSARRWAAEMQEVISETIEIREVEVPTEPDLILKAFGELRRELRQLLHDNGVRSNPGWTDESIVDALRKMITK